MFFCGRRLYDAGVLKAGQKLVTIFQTHRQRLFTVYRPEKNAKFFGVTYKFSSDLCYSFQLKPDTLKLRLFHCQTLQ